MSAFSWQERQAASATLQSAPARNGVRALALIVFALLLVLAGRAAQLAFSGPPHLVASPRPAATQRADLVDRNNVLLATTERVYALTALPREVSDLKAVADIVMARFPELDRTIVERRLSDPERQSIYLKRGLSEQQRAEIEALHVAGLGFVTEEKRVYPQGVLAGQAIGFTDIALAPKGGVELGLDQRIREAGAAGRPVRLSIDVRLQEIIDSELNAAAERTGASGASALLMDGKTGEILAIASWPAFNPNQLAQSTNEARRERNAGDVHELGSTLKPFTIAMALEDGAVTPLDRFDVSAPLAIDARPIHDHEPVPSPAGLGDILIYSSNIGAAQIALKEGADRQRAWLQTLGLFNEPTLEFAHRGQPIAPRAQSPRDVAALGFGYGLAASPANLASAYSVFANNGARVSPTLLAHDADAEIRTTPVFSAEVTRSVLAMLRGVVVRGTGRQAEVPGLEVAGKTGTAEKLDQAEGYQDARNFSSFAGLFPASDPRYVIVAALDEPQGDGAGGLRTGGAVAAPAVARMLERAAPILGYAVRRAN